MRLYSICIGFVALSFIHGTDAFALDAELSLKAKIKQLVELRMATINAPNDQSRVNANKEFVAFLRDALNDPKSFETNFDTIPQLSDLRSGDGYFRLINWNLPFDNQTNKYYCFLQMRDRKSKTFPVIELKQGYRNVKGEHRKVYSDNDWYGALYYKIVPAKGQNKGRKKTYMLIGWDGQNQYSKIKMVDVLTLTAKSARFGADMFDLPEKNAKRFIMEFKADASVSLKYDERKKMFIFNHLMPMQPDLEGMPEFYIPILEFDALEWRKGKWRYVEGIDGRLNERDDNYNDPPLPQKLKP